jgi:putative redox protein
MAEQNYSVVVTGSAQGFVQDVQLGAHHLRADEPLEAGGSGHGPDPYALLLASLGSCTSMTLGIYARRKGIPLQRVTVYLRHGRVYAADCDDCETKAGRVDQIERRIVLDGELTGEQRTALLLIADKCPVHRTLIGEIKIRTSAGAP